MVWWVWTLLLALATCGVSHAAATDSSNTTFVKPTEQSASNTAVSATPSDRTAAPDALGLPQCFISIGDWGSANSDTARLGAVMQRVMAVPSAFGCASPMLFVVSTGDNFYNYGVDSVTDPMWQSVWVDQFLPPTGSNPANGTVAGDDATVLKPVPWFVSLGNHDYNWSTGPPSFNITRASSQVDYSALAPRGGNNGSLSHHVWTMPFYYYVKDVALAGLPLNRSALTPTNLPPNGTGGGPGSQLPRPRDIGGPAGGMPSVAGGLTVPPQRVVRLFAIDTVQLIMCLRFANTVCPTGLLNASDPQSRSLRLQQQQCCAFPQQAAWLETELSRADDDPLVSFVVIFGHHAIASPDGFHVDSDLDGLLVPMLRRHRVSVLLQGHNHFIAWAIESNITNSRKNSLQTAPGNASANESGLPSANASSAATEGQLMYIINGAGRGHPAYPCSYAPGTYEVGTIAVLSDPQCIPADINDAGAIMIHRVVRREPTSAAPGRPPAMGGGVPMMGGGVPMDTVLQHCVVRGDTGTIWACRDSVAREFSPSEPTAAPPGNSLLPIARTNSSGSGNDAAADESNRFRSIGIGVGVALGCIATFAVVAILVCLVKRRRSPIRYNIAPDRDVTGGTAVEFSNMPSKNIM